jgi:hypothetical protein
MSTWSLKLWQKRRLIWQQRRVAGISAPGGERDRLFAHLLQRQCCAPPTLPSAARIFSEEVHLLNAHRCQVMATLRKIIEVSATIQTNH